MILERGYDLPGDNFTIVPNRWMRDTRLSRRARGLLVELMGHRAGWQTSIEHLAKTGPEGPAALKSGLSELEEAGYLVREWTRDERGRRSGTKYMIVDPAHAETAGSDEKPSATPSVENRLMDDSPSVDLPPMDKPPVANRSTKKNTLKEEPLQEEEKEENAAAAVLDVTHERAPASQPPQQPINDLESAIRAANLSARFDKLSPTEIATIETLILTHGIPALVASARSQHRADNPAGFAKAWIGTWLALPPRQIEYPARKAECDDCVQGWLPEDLHGPPTACPRCRPNLARH
jgi:hypothetical protein